MIVDLPRRLYRYRPLGDTYDPTLKMTVFERELDAITNHYVYASPFSALNDVMEAQIGYDLVDAPQLDAVVPGITTFVQDQIEELKRNAGVACFSETNADQSMWGIYASNSAGVCLEFDANLIEKISGMNGQSLFKAEYSSEPFRKIAVHEILSPDFIEPLHSILRRKSVDWCHEREWRILTGKHGKLFYQGHALTAIYLGSHISEKHRSAILAKFSGSHVKVKSCRIDGYKLQFDDVN